MMDADMLVVNMSGFEQAIEYRFRDNTHAVKALTHSSYANERKDEGLESNERLEFLGDSILSFTFSSKLFYEYPDMNEGDMTRIRAMIVCEKSLCNCSINLGIGDFLLLGKGEERTGGRKRPSILADAFEAIIGGIYQDSGLQPAQDFILRNLSDLYAQAVEGSLYLDHKTQLQEELQRNGAVLIEYKIVQEIGPDHDKLFISEVSADGKIMGQGQGKTKKEAEQQAAKVALNLPGMKNNN